MAHARREPPAGFRYEMVAREVRLKLSRTTCRRLSAARAEAGRLQRRLVRLHHRIREHQHRWPTAVELERHFRRSVGLCAQSVIALIDRFDSAVRATRRKRARGDTQARYPWRTPRYPNVLWPVQSVRVVDGSLLLSMPRGQAPIRVPLRMNLARGEQIAQVELGYGVLRLTIRRLVPEAPPLPRTAAGDLGVVNLIAVADGQDTLVISGRGLRSLGQRHHKRVAAIARLRSRCKKQSRRDRRLRWKGRQAYRKLERRRRNLLHQASRLVVDWCVAHEVGDLVLGDGLTGLHQTRSGEVSLHLNQVMSSSLQARFEQQVAYKCQRVGLAIRDEDERFTTRTCPACGALNSPRQRTSCCRTCSYSGPRDAVGAANLLNRIQHAGRIVPGMLVPDPGRIMYRLPARLWAGQRRAPAMGRAGSSPPVAVAAWPGDDGTAFRSPRKAE